MTYNLNRDGTVAVATEVYWNHNMDECPMGVKLQLLPKNGIAVYGVFKSGDTWYEAWAPLPRRRKNDAAKSD